MKSILCDECKADITEQAPPHGCSIPMGKDREVFLSVTAIGNGVRYYPDLCHACLLKLVRAPSDDGLAVCRGVLWTLLIEAVVAAVVVAVVYLIP